MGILNLMPCQDAPAIASLPHFYLASEELLEYFDGGVSPDKEKHNTFVYLEPVSVDLMTTVLFYKASEKLLENYVFILDIPGSGRSKFRTFSTQPQWNCWSRFYFNEGISPDKK